MDRLKPTYEGPMIFTPLKKASLLCAPALAALLMATAPLPAQAQGNPAPGGLVQAQLAQSEAPAKPDIDPDAAKVLSQMQSYLGGLKSFSVKYDSDFDVLSPLGQKLKFVSSGTIAAHRPGQLRVTRQGPVSDISLVLDGKTVTLLATKLNAYLQEPAASIDEAMEIVRDQFGFPAPGADLLVAKPFDLDATDVVSGVHLGMAVIGGQKAHHLAFRGRQVDWQLWVKDGPEPLPLRYVVTSKWTTGAPEYSLTLTDWNVAPTQNATTFTFTPPAGAKQITGIDVDDSGQIIGITE